MFARHTISDFPPFYVQNPNVSDSLEAPHLNEGNNSEVTPLVARLIDRACRGGEQAISVNDLSAEKLLEIMDYWSKNTEV